MYGHERSLVDGFSGRPFVLLGVNNDGKISRVKTAIKENELNWRSWYDGRSGPIVKEFGIRSFPTIFILDHNNVIRYKNLRGSRLDQALDSLVVLAEQAGMTGGSEPGAIVREFIDRSGKHKTKATYVGFNKGKIVLKKEDDSEIKVPWNKISLEDQKYVATQRLKATGLFKSANAEYRFDDPFKFTDKSGKHNVDATFIALSEGKAILWKTDGTQVSIPWSQLSDESKDFAKKEIKRMKNSL